MQRYDIHKLIVANSDYINSVLAAKI
jgi:hypothetical protein